MHDSLKINGDDLTILCSLPYGVVSIVKIKMVLKINLRWSLAFLMCKGTPPFRGEGLIRRLSYLAWIVIMLHYN